jgi:diacylglycerol kinase (ATP)
MMEREQAAGGTKILETVCDLERVAIIFNPASGAEDVETRRAALEELVHTAGLACELAETDENRGAGPLAQEAVADGMERVLVSGGDGSVMEAAGALAGTGVALAVLPGGTGNLLSLNMGLPTEAEAAMQVALTGEARPMDVGRADGTVFLMTAGMGMDAAMIRDADRELKDRLGVLAYFVAALRNIRRPPTPYSITIDGRSFQRRAQTVMVANLGRITGGVTLVPDTDPEDGQLEVAIVRARGVWDLSAVAWRALLGQLRGEPLLEVHRGREIVIETGTPQPVQLDGNEAEPTTRMEVHVEPGALRLVRTPDSEEVDAKRAVVPAAALSRARSLGASPLVLGTGAAALLSLRARTVRARGHKPGPVTRHPFLVGLSVGLASWLLQRRARGGRTPVDGPAGRPAGGVR